MGWFRLPLLGQEIFQVQRLGIHGQSAVGGEGPGRLGFVPIKLNAVLIRIAEIKSFADSVIRCPLEGNACPDQSLQGIGKFGPGGIKDGEMKEPRSPGGGGMTSLALPRIESDVMMIPACCEKRRLPTVTLGHLKAEDIPVEVDGAIKVGDLEVDMPDARTRMDGAFQ